MKFPFLVDFCGISSLFKTIKKKLKKKNEATTKKLVTMT